MGQQFLGDIGGGRIGVMTKEQVVAWLEGKDTRASSKEIHKNMKSTVEQIMATVSDPTAGGGSTRYTFDGTVVHHESNGAGRNKGATVFYVKRPGDVAKPVAVGYHIGAQTYGLTWVHHDWSAMRKVKQLTLDK